MLDADAYSAAGDEANAVMQIFHLLTVGTHLEKFTNRGKGGAHIRFFWVDLYTGEICWAKSPQDFVKNPDASAWPGPALAHARWPRPIGPVGTLTPGGTGASASAMHVQAVYEYPSVHVQQRKDYDPEVSEPESSTPRMPRREENRRDGLALSGEASVCLLCGDGGTDTGPDCAERGALPPLGGRLAVSSGVRHTPGGPAGRRDSIGCKGFSVGIPFACPRPSPKPLLPDWRPVKLIGLK